MLYQQVEKIFKNYNMKIFLNIESKELNVHDKKTGYFLIKINQVFDILWAKKIIFDCKFIAGEDSSNKKSIEIFEKIISEMEKLQISNFKSDFFNMSFSGGLFL